MYAENLHYGHADILLAHCEMPERPRIPLRLQHGWQPGLGMRAKDMAEPGPKLVWATRNLERAQAAGYAGAVAIGAPWLYLPARDDPGPEHSRSVLVVPFHGWEKDGLSGSMRAYADSLVALERRGFGPMTVCLYWFEYEQPALRELFEARGFATTTMGHRDDNPTFLHRQRELIWRHAYVSSNRVSTATFYALSLARPFFLHGPPAGLSASDDPSGARYDAWQRETFPALDLGPEPDLGALEPAVELGRRELGFAHRRDGDALRDLLLLGPAHRRERARLMLARRAHTVSAALGLGSKP